MQNYELAAVYVAALTQCPAEQAVIDVRAIHDRDDSQAAWKRRGTLPELWQWICSVNTPEQCRGIFVNIADMDGSGAHLIDNVRSVRCQVVDLDNIDAPQQFQRLAASNVAPAFAVNTSPNKYHVYWHTEYHRDLARFSTIQRKLVKEYNGDQSVIDPARVLRLPGTYHLKGTPHLVQFATLGSIGRHTSLDLLDMMLAHVDVSTSGVGLRQPLGTPELAAPSLDWIKYALAEIDPNNLDRGEWLTLIAAIKQSGWSLADEPTLYQVFADWCARYAADNPAENRKQWDSIRDSQAGWPSLAKRAPNTHVAGLLGRYDRAPALSLPAPPAPPMPAAVDGMPPVGVPVPTPPRKLRPADMIADEILTADQCQAYFHGCVFVVSTGKMRTPDNRMLGPSEFNVLYGGKRWIIDSTGKCTDEAWKAATRSTLWRVPSYDHLRFIPSENWGATIVDALGREGLNIYYPIKPQAERGDVTPFLQHIALLLPNPDDQRILIEYMAHNVKYPGFKIPWAPVIQSGQGAGKSILKEIMRWAVGGLYMHNPNAKELCESGSKFNAWMLHKLFICVDEIKVDERRELVEVLKPMISDKYIEMQQKGVDQRVEDNFANWMFFTNFKDAVPVDKDSRRFAIFYSAIQSKDDLLRRNMGEGYFNWLWSWIETGGYRYVTQWLLDYPIERGAIPMRSPWTSSMNEAFKQTRSPLEKLIAEAVDDKLTGFRGGYVSVAAVLSRAKQVGQMRMPSAKQVGMILDAMGYRHLGRAVNMVFQEDNNSRPDIYAEADKVLAVEGYAAAQGYK